VRSPLWPLLPSLAILPQFAIESGVVSENKNSGNAKSKATRGEVWGGGALSPEKNCRFSILKRPILVQTECFLYSSPKAGLNAVLGIGEGQNAKH